MMRKTYYILATFLLALNSQAAELSPTKTTTHSIDQKNSPNASIDLYELLKEEKNNRGAFVRKISSDLKQCTNGKMLELKYLPVKASYWWDRRPNLPLANDSHTLKPLSIDIKEGSSIYDREMPNTIYSDKYFRSGKAPINPKKFSNSQEMTREKLNFFYNQQYDNEASDLPKNIQPWVGYHSNIDFRKSLDTYPSVFHMIDIIKRLKHDQFSEPMSCPVSTKMIQSENPSSIIEKHIQHIFNQTYFKDFANQNHPLTHIVTDHLNKLLVFAQNKRFKDSNNPEYNKSVMYDKIMKNVAKIIYLMSAFEMDLTNNVSRIKGIEHWDGQFIPQNPYILYVQFYEIINDLLYLVMNLEDMYSLKDFDKILSSSYINRFPVLNDLQKSQSIEIHSYPARSGMEAFVNSAMSVGNVPRSIAISNKAGNLTNTLYFEIDNLSNQYLEARENAYEERKWVFIFQTKVNESSLAETRNSISIKYAEILIQESMADSYSGQDNASLGAFFDAKQAYDEMEEYLFYANDDDAKQPYDEMEEYFYYANDNDKGQGQNSDKDYFEKNGPQIRTQYETAKKAVEDKVFEEFLEINKEYKKTVSEQIQRGERVTVKPVFLNLSGMNSNDKEELYKKMSQDLINFIVLEIKKNINSFLHFTQFNNEMGIITLPDAWHPEEQNDASFTIESSFGYMTRFDAAPGILTGMTPDSLDIMNDPEKLEQLYTKIKSKKFVQENVFSLKQPFVILWDTTVEIDDSPSYRMIEKFKEEIKSGTVIFILFKSLQKYANLGVGKTKAGAITVIGKQSEYLAQITNNLKRYSKDIFSKGRKKDYSFMTFLYERVTLPQEKISQDNELLYYVATKQHAAKIIKDAPKDSPQPEISGGCIFIRSHSLDELGLPYSDTFSFAIPTATGIIPTSSLRRISVGLDPKGLDTTLYAVQKP